MTEVKTTPAAISPPPASAPHAELSGVTATNTVQVVKSQPATAMIDSLARNNEKTESKEVVQEGQVLRTSNPAQFRNQPFKCEIHNGEVELHPLTELETFAQMQGNRKAAASNSAAAHQFVKEFESPAGAALTNVGISLAITTQIEGRNYALLVKQNRGEDVVLKLISGYVDASQYLDANAEKKTLTAADLRSAFLTELNDELVVSRNGEAVPFLVAGLGPARRLPSAYGLPVSPAVSCTLEAKAVPSYVAAAQGSGSLQIQGERLENAAFYLHQPTGSGQIVIGAQLNLIPGSSLQHVEDVLNKTSGNLDSVVRSNDLVFMELDTNGKLTGKAHQMAAGRLSPLQLPSNTLFSEAFATPQIACVVQAKNVAASQLGF